MTCAPSSSDAHVADEVVALYDETGRVTGSARRSTVRAENLRHAASSVVVRDGYGRVYLHRRTLTKDVYPGLLDFAAGGVVLAGEDPAAGAVREAEEELGVHGVPVVPLGSADYADAVTRYRAFRFVTTYDGPIRWQPEEVSWGTWVTVDELVRRLDDDPASVVPDSVAVWADIVRDWAADRVPAGQGWDSETFFVEGRWVDRVPRRPAVAAPLLGEVALLQAIAGRLPLEVPRPTVMDRDPLRVRHPIVRGEPCRPGALTAADGAALGRFVRALHDLSPALVAEAGLPSGEYDAVAMVEQVGRFRADVLPLVPAALSAMAVRVLERVAVVGAQALCHGDLVAEHVLVRDGRVAGVIDWGDARVTDPAVDLAWPLHATPPPFAAAFARAYRVDAPTAERARDRWALEPWYAVHRDVFLELDGERIRHLDALSERLRWWSGVAEG
jgi:aminoglycoside phosphotransferase (APT) family kinase protein